MNTVKTIPMQCLKQGEVQTVFFLTVRPVTFIDMRIGIYNYVPCVQAFFYSEQGCQNWITGLIFQQT